MEFETLVNEQVYDSGTDSEIQVVFIPGIGGWKTWKHQLKYFSNRYRTLCVNTDSKSYGDTLSSVRRVLSKKNLSNAVIVGSDISNRVVQKLNSRKNVISTVMTNFSSEIQKPSKRVYKSTELASRKPKLLKKLFLSDNTSYRIARDLSRELEIIDYEDFRTFVEIENTTDIENGLVIQAKDDRFSSVEDAKKLLPDITIREVAGGSFCFYEKPEEFNNALSEYTERLEDFIKSKQIREKREKNRSLEEFESNDTFQGQLEIRK